LYNSPKILIRQLGSKINAAFDSKGEYVTSQTIYNLQITCQEIAYEYILALLNSNLMNFYYITLIREKKLFPRILLENIKQIPIIIPEKSVQKKITHLVNEILVKKENGENIADLEEKIDDLIFKIYSIDESEKKYILEL